MGFRFPGTVKTKRLLQRSLSMQAKRHRRNQMSLRAIWQSIYVGDETNNMKRFVIPLPYLNQPIFRELLCRAEEEFGFDHPMGGLTIPCNEGSFIDLITRLNAL